jgi:peptidoglycan/xylan/chitin deacetylase (PgdA/CDA1 family)
MTSLRSFCAAAAGVAVLAGAATAAAWGTLDDVRYKVKPQDGNLWADRYARGAILTGKIRERKLMFTFDDGPYWPTTTRLLDILDGRHIKTAFFVSGFRLAGRDHDAVQNRRTLREAYRRGHLIGNHAYLHQRLTDFAPEDLRYQIDEPARLIREVTGEAPRLFRPPFAVTGPVVLGMLAERGYTPVLWCIDPVDWLRETPEEVYEATVRAIEERRGEGGIVLLHDTHAATVQAFPRILEWLDAKNAEYRSRGEPPYELVGLDAFFARRHAN